MSYFNSGYVEPTLDKLCVVLPFKMSGTLQRIFKLSPDESRVGTLYAINNDEETATSKINNKPYLEHVGGYLTIRQGEGGWVFIHTNPAAASRLIKQYEAEIGQGRYGRMWWLFGRHNQRLFEKKIREDAKQLDGIEAEIIEIKEGLERFLKE